MIMRKGQAVVPMPYSDEVQILMQTNLCCLLCGERGIWIKYAEANDDPKLTKPTEAHCPHCERSFTYIVAEQTGIDTIFSHHINRQIKWQSEEEIRLAQKWWDSMTPEEQEQKRQKLYQEDTNYSPLISFMSNIK